MVTTARAPDQICSLFFPSPLRSSGLSAPQSLVEHDKFSFERLAVRTRRVACRDALYRKHDSLRMLYLVRFGQFKLIAGGLDEPHVAGFQMAGDLMGMDAIATSQHNLDAVALESSEVYEIPFVTIAEKMSIEPAIQCEFLRTIGQTINVEYSQSLSLRMNSLDRRFAAFLLLLSEKYACLGYSDRSFRLSMSRGDIGSYLGTSLESVSRLVQRFNAHGAVSIKGRTVELRDRAYLQSIVCGGLRAI